MYHCVAVVSPANVGTPLLWGHGGADPTVVTECQTVFYVTNHPDFDRFNVEFVPDFLHFNNETAGLLDGQVGVEALQAAGTR
jgi:hypothetical protein